MAVMFDTIFCLYNHYNAIFYDHIAVYNTENRGYDTTGTRFIK